MQVTKLTDQHIDTSSILDRARGRGSSILKVLTSNPKIAVGVGVVAFFVLIAFAAPLLTPYDPDFETVMESTRDYMRRHLNALRELARH